MVLQERRYPSRVNFEENENEVQYVLLSRFAFPHVEIVYKPELITSVWIYTEGMMLVEHEQ